MRRAFVPLIVMAVTFVALAPPALAQEGSSARPWHYWIAPFLLAGAILSLIALFVGYYVRVMSRGRR